MAEFDGMMTAELEAPPAGVNVKDNRNCASVGSVLALFALHTLKARLQKLPHALGVRQVVLRGPFLDLQSQLCRYARALEV
jgi:hypothetical protein